MPRPSISIPTAPHFPGNQTGSNISPAPVPGALKRKRPPTIEIPNVLCEISAQATPESASSSSCGYGFAVSSSKGKKKLMEDTHKTLSCPRSVKGFFGVYDGHGGRKAAEFVAENLHTNILEMIENCADDEAKEKAVKAGYLKTDREFLKQGLGSGACCLTVLIDENEIVVSNLGDCRAVLCRGGVAVALTKDHTAEEEDERKRIESQGGYVEMHRGAWRVHGVLSVSRSIGDAHLKDWISSEPDTKILKLTPDMEYLILASDGLWKEVGNQEAVDIVKRPCLMKTQISSVVDSTFGLLSSTSPSPASRRILAVKKQKTGLKKKMEKEEEDVALGFSSRCPSPMSKRVSLLKQKAENYFADENDESLVPPPLKTRKVSFQTDDGFKSDKKMAASCNGLVAACNELVNLAVRKGSLDDVTVIIIDLGSFQNRTISFPDLNTKEF